MVAGFIPDGEAIKNKNIKIGDWLRSVNSNNITYQNLDHVLSEITVSTNVSNLLNIVNLYNNYLTKI